MSTTLEQPRSARPSIGAPVDRIDGPLKVAGAAPYAADTPVNDALHAVLVQATIPRGRIAAIDDGAARAVPGVVEILTFRNAPRVRELRFDWTTPMPESLAPLQDDVIRYDGQHVAAVVARTFEAAREAAALLQIRYDAEAAHLDIAHPAETRLPDDWFGDNPQSRRGDPEAAFAAAPVQIDATYTTPVEHHNPLEPSATVAQWNGDDLVVHDATQWVIGARNCLAAAFGIAPERVRVLSPYVGGGFGCKGWFWAHTLIAAMAAKHVGRPVKLALTREQMFTSAGHRSETVQRLRVGAARDGRLAAIRHDVRTTTSRVAPWVETAGAPTKFLFACDNVGVHHEVALLDVTSPTAMRAPGEAPGTYALGSALDELAYACGLDPLELLRRNHADTDADEGLPYSSKHLLACYARGAEHFGWERRAPQPRAMRDGRDLVGYGVATAVYPALRSSAQARVTVGADGTIEVATAAHDLGTGLYTIVAQVAADAFGVAPHDVRVSIGDSSLPPAPVAGGSMTTATVTPAVADAARRAIAELVALASRDPGSPLFGLGTDAIVARDGALVVRGDPSRAAALADVLKGSGVASVAAVGEAAPGDESRGLAMYSFGAQFVEVRVDPDFGTVRVSRALGAFDCGRIINAKTARSQMIGGIVWGIGMALLEESVRDARTGAFVTNNLADYHVPVNADIPPIDVLFVEEPDYALNPLGARGIGEIGITGVAAAIANAVYHATGIRVRDLPIVPEKLLASSRSYDGVGG
ncbi:dehydrogenase [Vulcanimicrobium alpinum]|uniref:Dehydrogenase n=1 Tax=Vulcanimicrobium alpinum TaxID=3016050 RepID=A0AAN2C8U7_UNVUL|nr:xanthine dehydrogenase family protein molybdopterin-binding subunit [Vulcanimicrobium alpinum]BDE05336.1 dehydrogenase [Vulcanimicrobium alpinum]